MHTIWQVLTGDSMPVAKRVCEELEIPSAVCVLGSQLALLEDDDFAAVVEQASIFAKVFFHCFDAGKVLRISLTICDSS